MDKDTDIFPYKTVSEVKFRNDEPLTYANFNAHIIRLLQNAKALNRAITLQKATDKQWGVVKLATVDDIISDDGDKNAVVTNEVINKTIDHMRVVNDKKFRLTGKIDMSKNYEWQHGEFVVGVNESIAKRITKNADRVVYANIYFVPLGFDNKPFHMANSVKGTDSESFKNNVKNCGVINFDEWQKPKGYEEFHVYYHKSGYVICRNGRLHGSQKQIKVVWNLLMRK